MIVGLFVLYLVVFVALAVGLDALGVSSPWSGSLPIVLASPLMAGVILRLRRGITGGQPEFYVRRSTDERWLHGHGHGELGLLRFQPYSGTGLRLRLPRGSELALPVESLAIGDQRKLEFRDVWWNGDFGFRRVRADTAAEHFEVAAYPVVLQRLDSQIRTGTSL